LAVITTAIRVWRLYRLNEASIRELGEDILLHLWKHKDTLSDVSEAEDVKWMLCQHLQILTPLGIRPFCFVKNPWTMSV
jgi:hypothetical protein